MGVNVLKQQKKTFCSDEFDSCLFVLAALPALRQKSPAAQNRERGLFKEILCILKAKTPEECIQGKLTSLHFVPKLIGFPA